MITKEVFVETLKKIKMGDKKIEECLMIGDKFEVDLKGAMDIGMDVIAVDYFNKIKDNDLYPVIRKFSELKKLL